MTTPTPAPKKTLSDSTRRAIRTGYHALVALVTLVPILALIHGTPADAQIAVFVGWLTVVSKAMNLLEDKGLIPAWLKG